ncbi:hypothetical protein T4C_6871 [Trichinella pseudospiralis]|uniref:Uncharacterized protein n=1 Tax=Trichinella pseudospiralis TaxID=6337 RepID=A0A0V1IR39_TRIPS|nr:hypothetical protein T4C_6871 [Trichinella pseudospiralis]
MTSRCDSNPAQYERNRGIRHLRSRHYTTVAGSWDRLRKSNFSKSVELNQTALAIPLRMTTLESIEAQRAVNTLRSDETHPGNRFARRRIKKNFFFIPFVYLGEFRGMEDGKNFPSPTMGSFSSNVSCIKLKQKKEQRELVVVVVLVFLVTVLWIGPCVRYNCMQQLIAPSATCDSNAKDRTKLQNTLGSPQQAVNSTTQFDSQTGDRVATPQTPRPKLTCVHVVSVCYHMQTTSRQPKGPRVTVNITTLFKTGTLLLSGLSKKSWDMKKVRPAYIGDRVATPQTPRPKLTCVHVVSVCYHMQTTSRQPKGPRVTVNITTLFKTGTLLLSGLSKKSWDMKKVRPAYIGDRVATPQTPRPKLTCVHVVSVCYHMQTTSRQPKGPRVTTKRLQCVRRQERYC